ncbi:MAG: VOC family protein [Pseudomonadales bacterium]|nr:VOC family protein [Pseudomonadales bacterium]
MMIGYVTLGCNDLAGTATFYDGLLAELGGKRFMEMERSILWGVSPKEPMLGIIKPFDGNPASVGNGVMVSLKADSPEQVDKVHAKALALGGRDEGAAGPRGDSGFYGGYFRDPEGNKLVVYCMSKPN